MKPQSKIRPEPDSETVQALLISPGRVSFESDGGIVAPRAGGGREMGLLVPDFVVARTDGHLDATLLLVEIKTRELGPLALRDARIQLGRYMAAALRVKHMHYVYGLLATGSTAALYRLSTLDEDVLEVQGLCDISGMELHAALRAIVEPIPSSGPTRELGFPSSSSFTGPSFWRTGQPAESSAFLPSIADSYPSHAPRLGTSPSIYGNRLITDEEIDGMLRRDYTDPGTRTGTGHRWE